jgi:hypothetical protein
MDEVLPPTSLMASDATSSDIANMLPTLKNYYGKKYMPKSAGTTKARKTAAEKILAKEKQRIKKDDKKGKQ